MGKPVFITGAATTLVKTGPGILNTIVLEKTAAGAIDVYDGLDTSGTKIARRTYSLPTDALQIRRVEVKDQAGIWKIVNPIR